MSLRVELKTFRDLIWSSAASFSSLALVRNANLYLIISTPPAQTDQHKFTEKEFSEDDWVLIRMFASSIEPLSNMRVFRLIESPFFKEAEMQQFLPKVPGLQELELTGSTEVTDSLLKGLGQTCPCLRKLNFSFCPQISDLTDLASCQELASLSIAECRSVKDAGLKTVIHRKQLTYLNVMGTKVSEESLLLAAICCRSLETLVIGKSDITISKFAKKELTRLKKLFLVQMHVESSDLFSLATAAPHLEEVSLKGSTGFSLDSLRQALKSWDSLRVVILLDSSFLDQELEALKTDFPNLNILL